MVKELEAGMQALSQVIRSATGKDISNIPGAGAAGGMGGGFLAFLNAELKPGIRLMLDALDFGKKIKGADLIFTGEGRAIGKQQWGKCLPVSWKRPGNRIFLSSYLQEV
mgnify:CR=1 FL=1